MAMKHQSPGSSGGKGPLRDWSTPSYSATDGRAITSIGNHHYGRGSPSTTHAENVSAQIPSAFDAIDKRRTQGRTPVKHRAFTDKHEG